MSHLDERAILELRDGVPVDAEARTHLDACPDCQAALRLASDRATEIEQTLAELDEEFDVEAAREAVRLRVAVARGPVKPPSLPGRSHSFAWPLGRAATFLLLTAGALSALPGSPVRSWWTNPGPTAPTAEVPTGGELQRAAPRAGGRVTVSGGPIDVVLDGVDAGTMVEVVWVEGSAVAVYSAPGSDFTYSGGRVEATISGGPVTVELPRAVHPATLLVNGRTYLVSSAASLDLPGPVESQDTSGLRFVVPGA